jgi:hypothetical protein
MLGTSKVEDSRSSREIYIETCDSASRVIILEVQDSADQDDANDSVTIEPSTTQKFEQEPGAIELVAEGEALLVAVPIARAVPAAEVNGENNEPTPGFRL